MSQFRIGERVAIVCGAWKGYSGRIVQSFGGTADLDWVIELDGSEEHFGGHTTAQSELDLRRAPHDP